MLPRLVLTFAFAGSLFCSAAVAQTQPPAEAPAGEQVAQYDAPAYISTIDGTATLERDGRIEPSPLNMPLLSGDRLRTTDGRIEVRFADGGRLHLDTATSVDVLSDELIRLGDGRVRLTVVRSQQVRYRIDSASGSVRILQPGEYRVALLRADRETQLELAVIRGGGEIFTESGATPVRAGERAYASAGLAPSYTYAYNSASADDFDRWVETQRGTVYAAAGQSAQYLPEDVSGYSSTFDQYGDWRYQSDYGYVWYPRVAADWRPYYYGRWAAYPTYGWTWIPRDPFGYPTHHYGRWGFSSGVWFWIPTRHHWGPAYVSWGYATDYVSWCPLGWNNRAVFSINIFNVGPRYYAAGPRYYSAWTIVPRSHFGHGYAHEYAVRWDRDRGGNGVRPRFTEGRAPAYDRAIPRRASDDRGVAPIRYAGTRTASPPLNLPAGTGSRAVPRAPGETPRYVNRGDEIVRSQTARPVAPADRAVPRTAPQVPSYSAPARRDPRAWDNPAYRPPATTETPGAYERAVPRATAPEAPAGSIDRRTVPQPRPYAPPPRSYTPPNRGDARPNPPAERSGDVNQGSERAVERPIGGRPGVGYERRSGSSERPNPGYERSSGAAERPRPEARPSGGAERPAERARPAPPSAPSGERAVPRNGGAPPQAAPSRGEARPSGSRGRGSR